MEYSIQDIIEYIVADLGIEYDKAMHFFTTLKLLTNLQILRRDYILKALRMFMAFFKTKGIGNLIQTEM